MPACVNTSSSLQAIDKQQMTALHLAASHDEVEVCRMLIERSANLRCCDEEMGTPLHFACMEGSEKVRACVRVWRYACVCGGVCQRGAEDEKGMTLHFACREDGEKVCVCMCVCVVVCVLVSVGACVDVCVLVSVWCRRGDDDAAEPWRAVSR